MLRHCVQENTAHHAQQMRVSAYARARTLARARTHRHTLINRAQFFSTGIHVINERWFACTLRVHAHAVFLHGTMCALRSCLSIYRIYLYMFLSVLRVRCAATVSIYCARTLFFSTGQTMRRALCSYLARTTTSISIYSTRTLFFSTRVRVTMCVPHALCLLLHRTACDIERDFSRRGRCTRACCVGSRVA